MTPRILISFKRGIEFNSIGVKFFVRPIDNILHLLVFNGRPTAETALIVDSGNVEIVRIPKDGNENRKVVRIPLHGAGGEKFEKSQ